MPDPLSALALQYGSDKGPAPGHHDYTPWYHALFQDMRTEVRAVLEIGVLHGASLRMWREYFPNATVHGLDYAREVTAESLLALEAEERLRIHIGDQSDKAVLATLAQAGPFDIVVDDASHAPNDYLTSFAALWPVTRRAYCIEDVVAACYAETRDALLAVPHRALDVRQSETSADRWLLGLLR